MTNRRPQPSIPKTPEAPKPKVEEPITTPLIQRLKRAGAGPGVIRALEQAEKRRAAVQKEK